MLDFIKLKNGSLKNTVKVIKKGGGGEGGEGRERWINAMGVVIHTGVLAWQKAEEGSSRVQRPEWSTQQIPGQPGYTLRLFLQKQNHKKKKITKTHKPVILLSEHFIKYICVLKYILESQMYFFKKILRIKKERT